MNKINLKLLVFFFIFVGGLFFASNIDAQCFNTFKCGTWDSATNTCDFSNYTTHDCTYVGLQCSPNPAVCPVCVFGNICEGTIPTVTPTPPVIPGDVDGRFDMYCSDDSPLEYTLVVDNMVGNTFNKASFILAFRESNPEDVQVMNFIGDPNWDYGNWEGYLIRDVTSLTTTNPKSVEFEFTESEVIGKSGNKTLGELADWVDANQPGRKFEMVANVALDGVQKDYIDVHWVRLDSNACIPEAEVVFSCTQDSSYGDVNISLGEEITHRPYGSEFAYVQHWLTINKTPENQALLDWIDPNRNLYTWDYIPTNQYLYLIKQPSSLSTAYPTFPDSTFVRWDGDDVIGNTGKTLQQFSKWVTANMPQRSSFLIGSNVRYQKETDSSTITLFNDWVGGMNIDVRSQACDEGAGWGIDNVSVCYDSGVLGASDQSVVVGEASSVPRYAIGASKTMKESKQAKNKSFFGFIKEAWRK